MNIEVYECEYSEVTSETSVVMCQVHQVSSDVAIDLDVDQLCIHQLHPGVR
jgi:hypothetical protein